MLNMLLLGLSEIWGWHIDKISATIIVERESQKKIITLTQKKQRESRANHQG